MSAFVCTNDNDKKGCSELNQVVTKESPWSSPGDRFAPLLKAFKASEQASNAVLACLCLHCWFSASHISCYSYLLYLGVLFLDNTSSTHELSCCARQSLLLALSLLAT